MSFLVLTNRTALVLDAGTGLARLLEPTVAALVQPYKHLHIALSHYHSDHVIGFFSLAEGWPGKPITVYAPEKPLVDAVAEDALRKLFDPPFFAMPLDRFLSLEIVPYSADHVHVAELTVAIRRQQHGGGSVGMRFGDRFAYVTDTIVDEQTVKFIRGVGLLLHEVWLTDEQAQQEPGEASRHSHVSGVADIARRAGVKRLMPIHIRPTCDFNLLDALVRQLRETCPGIDVLYPHEAQCVEL